MTRAERLDALVAKVAPKKKTFFDAHGRWPLDEELGREDGALVFAQDGENKFNDPKRQAPYEIRTLNGDRRRVLITDDDGSTIAAIGANIEEALAGLEAKVA
jgi:hypothetical protein